MEAYASSKYQAYLPLSLNCHKHCRKLWTDRDNDHNFVVVVVYELHDVHVFHVFVVLLTLDHWTFQIVYDLRTHYLHYFEARLKRSASPEWSPWPLNLEQMSSENTLWFPPRQFTKIHDFHQSFENGTP